MTGMNLVNSVGGYLYFVGYERIMLTLTWGNDKICHNRIDIQYADEGE